MGGNGHENGAAERERAVLIAAGALHPGAEGLAGDPRVPDARVHAADGVRAGVRDTAAAEEQRSDSVTLIPCARRRARYC